MKSIETKIRLGPEAEDRRELYCKWEYGNFLGQWKVLKLGVVMVAQLPTG